MRPGVRAAAAIVVVTGIAACGGPVGDDVAPTAAVTAAPIGSTPTGSTPTDSSLPGVRPTEPTGSPAPSDAALERPAPPLPPGGLIETFSDPADLSQWRVSYGEAMSGGRAQVSVEDGALRVVAAHSEWLDNSHATGIARSVDGDVTVVADIDVAGVSAPEPDVDWSLAGIMLRAPGMQGDESWVHWSTGQVLGPVLERKSTRNGASVLSVISIEPGPVTLQLIRAGEQIILLHRQGDQPWQRDVVYGRDDLPAAAEILLTAQSGGESDHADMVAVYDNVTITPGAPPPAVIAALLDGDTSGLPR